MITLIEIVKTILLEVTETYEGDVTLKLEVLKKGENYSTNLYKMDTFCLQPTGENELADEIFWVDFSQILPLDNQHYLSVDDAVKSALEAISKYYEQ